MPPQAGIGTGGIGLGAAPQAPDPETTGEVPVIRLGRSLQEIERDVIETTIRLNDGSIPKAARALSISPSTIYRKKESWGE